MYLIMVRHLVSVLAYCCLPLPLAMPVEHCAHSKFLSGSAISFGPEIRPCLFLQAQFSVTHPPLLLLLFLLLLITCNLLSCKALSQGHLDIGKSGIGNTKRLPSPCTCHIITAFLQSGIGIILENQKYIIF